MSKHVVPASNTEQESAKVDPIEDLPGPVMTPESMVEFLLNSAGKSVVEIATRIGATEDVVKQNLMVDGTSFNAQTATKEVQRLRNFVLKEQLKFVYRANGWTGPDKASKRIGIPKSEFTPLYNDLIGSGEVAFKMDVPKWPEFYPESNRPDR